MEKDLISREECIKNIRQECLALSPHALIDIQISGWFLGCARPRVLPHGENACPIHQGIPSSGVGVFEAALEDSIEYAKQRVAFGRTIGK